ncbi:cytochrome-c peroxidase [Methylocapsa palsarum]|uniref:Cytochrome c peroxidase n=1 Tax=Methylocapsa palsarum TaxID=1612308 RepID=A0A1I4BTL9_9HYPH|nr:cytochrome-c peroxidase [Methylocapsa palsarum]SFK71369.1 cytochrome c peroxidase [Methylocapsa palsarum]
MLKRVLAAAAVSGVALASPAGADDLMTKARQLFEPLPKTAPALPGNPSTPAKLDLGKKLFFEPRLSASHAISCNSCHNLGLGGADAEPTSIGHNWQRGGRNSPTVFNAAFNVAQFWDGRAKDLEEQAGGPMINPVEMASLESQVGEQLKGIPGYKAAFSDAFPGEADPVTKSNAQKAIAVFEATLITPDAPFDRFLNGDANALSASQKEGLALFMEKGCSDCHNGINIGGGRYAQFGAAIKPGVEYLPQSDKGRFAVTKDASDENVYKVPTLRNITLTAPYFHTGKVWDLRQAVQLMAASQLGEQITPGEIDKITDFLASLTGDQPQVSYPILPPNVASTPKPAL